MTIGLSLILEDAQGEHQEVEAFRIAVHLNDRDLWLEPDGQGGLTLYAESFEDEVETPVITLRPQAVNQFGLTVSLEPVEDGHEHGPDCGCEHDH
ncbi:hypothetical protein IQ22_02911 [Pseudomonas duriflava]|uniref:Uncharacterized protein n=1 Tax=Pseudomonas duriflava TaxID=459528 RepID=A0A562Q8K1_9PSED|nr:GTPase [Pseudomonas duriflava]TWI53072.1 hypothetical protein IQ22_02911 [Pseudomonas duriflava]